MTDLADIRLNSPETSKDAFAIYTGFRDAGGILWSKRHKAWIVSRFDLARSVLTHQNASVEKLAPFARQAEDGLQQRAERMQQIMGHWPPFLDPPGHTRMRRVLQRSFAPRMLTQHEEPIRQITGDILDGIAGRGEIEFMADFASELPARAIAYLYGLPQSDTPMLKRWSEGVAEFVLGSDKADRYGTSLRVMEEMREHFSALVARYPGPGAQSAGPLMQQLLDSRDEPDGLSDEEVVATLVLILFAAPETTANMILNGMFSLVCWPEELEKLMADPAGIPRAIEELIRYDGPVPVVVRVAGDEMQVGPATIAKGDRIFILLKSSNRDTAQFDRPDALVLDRERSPHLGFGSGIHMCVGAPLARLEARIAFEEFLKRYETITMPGQEIVWRHELLAHSPKALHLTLAQRNSA